MEEEIKNLLHIWLSVTASLCYCYFIASRIPKGKYRLLSLLPILSLFTILPLRLTHVFPIFAATAVTWLANFNLLLLAFDMGPLSSYPQKSLPFFITLACLPTRITNQNQKSQITTKPRNLALSLAFEIVIFSFLMGFLHDHRERLVHLQHGIVLVLLYCLLVFLLVDILFAFSNVSVLLGLEIEPPSDEPYLATSLRDFWGRRWNLTVTNILRHTVYKPVWAATVGVLGRQWAQLVGVFSTFLVSGLMHELFLFYITRVSPTWEMTGFFVLHGVCVSIEKGVKRALFGQWQLHWAVSRPMTVGFVVASSFWLFFPPLMRNSADVRAIEEFKMFIDFIKRKLIHML